MRTTKIQALTVGIAAMGLSLQGLGAILVDTTPGTGAAPATLGGYTMVAYDQDARPDLSIVSDAPSPAGYADLTFTPEVQLRTVPTTWSTWSHGYTGDVYFSQYENELLIGLPDGTLAFYLYIEPTLFGQFDFEVSSETAVATLNIEGNAGAQYVGFYSNDPSDELLFVFVKQPSNTSEGFAVGEFGINIPEPQTYALLAGLGLLGFAGYRRLKA